MDGKRIALADFVWTTVALAEEAGVTVSYVGRLCRQGRLDAMWVGGRWLIADESARRWMRTRRGPGRPRADDRPPGGEQLDLDLHK